MPSSPSLGNKLKRDASSPPPSTTDMLPRAPLHWQPTLPSTAGTLPRASLPRWSAPPNSIHRVPSMTCRTAEANGQKSPNAKHTMCASPGNSFLGKRTELLQKVLFDRRSLESVLHRLDDILTWRTKQWPVQSTSHVLDAREGLGTCDGVS
jgi:hypothetical protein